MTRRLDVLVCSGAACVSSHSAAVRDALFREIEENGLSDEIRLVETGCMGPCELGPVMLVYPDGAFYIHVKAEDAAEIVQEHFLKGRPVKRLLWEDPEARRIVEGKKQVPFFEKQKADGYEALGKTLTQMKPDDVIKVITDSGLRGRGGAGFPTGRKWQFVASATGETKYVVCNGDEGDPGAFMDRSLLEGDPHAVIEGMTIAAYAVGANRGYIYIRAEYRLETWVYLGRTFSRRASHSISKCEWGRARSSVEKRPLSSPRSKESVAHRACVLPTLPCAACSGCQP